MEDAIRVWQVQLGADSVLASEDAGRRFGPNTYGKTQRVAAAVFPRSTGQVAEVVKVARRYRTPLYPISTGRNWGDGTASPITEDCVIVDLSRMNQIISIDTNLDLVTLQPGVTQQILRDYLDQAGLKYLVPVTGAGPTCSIVGNALERGFGITPHSDHFGAVTAIEAVLPDGEIYRSGIWDSQWPSIDRTFKWGLGPYLDGLFAQGNFGIVTEMTIRLCPEPERIELAYFGFKEDGDLETAVEAIRRMQRACGANVSGINLMNPLRLLATTIPYPKESVPEGGVIPDHLLADLVKRHRIKAWTGAVAIYGEHRVVSATRAVLRDILKPVACRLVFLTAESIRRAKRIVSWLPCRIREERSPQLCVMEAAFQVLSGIPSEVPLRLAYWRSGKTPPLGQSLDPARDGCGLLWYAPLVPMLADRVRAFATMVRRVCHTHGIEPVITFTSVADGCFISTVPLLFDQNDASMSARVGACYEALLAGGKKEGCFPYRGGAPQMPLLVEPERTFWKFVKQLKQAVDPDDIIAPGRYSPTQRQTNQSPSTKTMSLANPVT